MRLKTLLGDYPATAAAAGGLLITIAQLLFVLQLAQHPWPWADAYQRLFRWDSIRYGEIVQNGYWSRLPHPLPDSYPVARRVADSNVAFFPGYPAVVAAVQFVTRLPLPAAMSLTSQLCAAGFWACLLMLLARWRVRAGVAGLAVLAVAAHPGAFYLVLPYSESLFLLALTALFLLCERGDAAGAAASGSILTATRLFGLPFCAWPALREWARGGEPGSAPRYARAVAVGAASALGLLGFLAYSQAAFGHWNLYFLQQAWEWGIAADLLALPREFAATLLGNFRQAGDEFNGDSRLLTTVTLWMLAGASVLEVAVARFAPVPGWRLRALLLAFAWLSFYLPYSALANVGFASMLRYTLLPHLLLTLQLACLASRAPLSRRALWPLALAALLIVEAGFAWQAVLAFRHTDGDWVARA